MKNNYLEALETAWRIANDGFPNGNEEHSKIKVWNQSSERKRNTKKFQLIAKRDVDDF